jgi:LacI family transcriptional regulator
VAERVPEYMTLALSIPYLYDTRVISEYPSLKVNILPTLVHLIEEEAHRAGWNIMLYIGNNDPCKERSNFGNILSRRPQAVIEYYTPQTENLDCLKAVLSAGIPVVSVDDCKHDIPMDYVITDNFLGSYLATKCLLDNGFEQIYYMTPDPYNVPSKERLDGYRDVMSRYHSPASPIVLDWPPKTADWESVAHCAALSLLTRVDGPFAIVASEPLLLRGVWSAVSEAGLSHESFALACFDEPHIDIPDDVLFVRVLQPLEQIAKRSVEIAVAKFSGDTRIHQVRLEPAILTGRNTAALLE